RTYLVGRPALAAAGAVSLVLRADPDQPRRGYQRTLLFRPRDQGGPGGPARHQGSALSQAPDGQQGTFDLLHQVSPGPDRYHGAVRQLWQESPNGQSLLHLLWESTPMTLVSGAIDLSFRARQRARNDKS